MRAIKKERDFKSSGISYKAYECVRCGRTVYISQDSISGKCWKCTAKMVPYKEEPQTAIKHPFGWKQMEIYVDAGLNVFYLGEEQVKLKGTLPASIIDLDAIVENREKNRKIKAQKKKDALDKLIKEHALKAQYKKAKAENKKNNL